MSAKNTIKSISAGANIGGVAGKLGATGKAAKIADKIKTKNKDLDKMYKNSYFNKK